MELVLRMKRPVGSEATNGDRRAAPALPRDLPAEYFVELIDSIDGFIILTDDELRIVRANRATSLLSGFSNRELAEKSLLELVESGERRKLRRILSANSGRCGGETTMVSKGSASVRVEYSASRVPETKEGFAGILFVCRPKAIPEGFEARSATKGIRKRILNSIGEPLFVISFPARVISDCNQCAVALSGRPRSELIGRNMLDFMDFGDKGGGTDAKAELVNDAYAGTGYFHSRVDFVRKGGVIPCDCFSIPFIMDSGYVGYTILVLFDRSEEEKRKLLLTELAERAERLSGDLSSLAVRVGSRQGGRLLSAQGFSPRQVEIAKLVFEGCPSKEIGGKLGISESTVKNHLAAMFRKIGATSRVDFIHKLIEDRIWIA